MSKTTAGWPASDRPVADQLAALEELAIDYRDSCSETGNTGCVGDDLARGLITVMPLVRAALARAVEAGGIVRCDADEQLLRAARELLKEPIQPQLGDPSWDRVYGSLIFERSKPIAREATKVYPSIWLGGTGWDFAGGIHIHNNELPPEAEAMQPDYSGYPSFTASLGFTQRGCRLSCDFCVVPRKEGKVRAVGTLAQLHRGDEHPHQYVLLDNDFFGNPNHPAIIDEARELDAEVALIQGINARLLSPKHAKLLASIRLKDGKFKRRRLYTAWDGRKDEHVLFRGLRNLVEAGFSPDMIMVYMLIGHEPGETHADRDYRRQKLRDFGCRPYPMPFTRDGDLGAELVAFSRWVVQRKDMTDPTTGKPYVPWDLWWGKARGEPRKLGSRRVTLPLFPEPTDDDDNDPETE